MLKRDSFSDFINVPYLLTNNNIIKETSSAFIELTHYLGNDVLEKEISEVIGLLRVNCTIIDIEKNLGNKNLFFFTKSYEPIEVIITMYHFEDTKEKIYVFMEKPNSRLSDKTLFISNIFTDNILATAIYSVPEMLLLKVNQKYLNFMESPYNILENSIGKPIREIVPGLEGTQTEENWNMILEKQKTCFVKENRFDMVSRGVTYWDSTKTPVFENGKMKYVIDMAVEVTEQVNQLRIIEKQKKQLEAIIENMSDAIAIYNRYGQLVQLNAEARKMYPHLVENTNVTDVHSDFLYYDLKNNPIEKDNLPTRRAFHGETVRNERIIIEKPNKVQYTEINATPIFDSKGDIDEIAVSHRDISAEIEMQRMIEAQKKHLEAVINSMSDGLFLLGKNNVFTFLNQAGKNFFYQPENISKNGDSFDHTRYYDMRENILSVEDMVWSRALKSETIKQNRIKVVRPDKIMYFSMSGSPIIDNAGDITSAIICCRDITEQMESDQLVYKQKKQLEAVIENMSDTLAVIDKDGNYQNLFKAKIGIGKTELMKKAGDSYESGKYFDDKGDEILKENLPICKVTRGEIVKNERVKIKFGNDFYHFEFNGTPIFDSKGDYEIGVVCGWDITEKVKLEELKMLHADFALKKEIDERKILEDTIRIKDEFLSIISHEFKTPLTVINTAIQAMENICKDELTDTAKRFLKNIKQNSFRQWRLVNNLLDITRINAGRTTINRRNIDIIFLTREIIESVGLYAQQKGLRLFFESAIERKITGVDDEKYERILLNLLSNAIKYTPKDGYIKVKVSSTKGYLKISIKDTGVGIPKDKQELIFERFGQVDSSLTRQAEGTGIGLYLVKMLVESLGGTISVNSKVGSGSTFSFTLPLMKISDIDENNQSKIYTDNRLIQSVAIEFSDIYL